MKWEHNDYSGSEWQPSARILWQPVVNLSLWTSIARAVRTPSIFEQKVKVLASSVPPPVGIGNVYVRGSEDFESEAVVAYEAGYRN